MATRYCYLCKQWLDEVLFYSDASRPTGLDNKCKTCTLARHRVNQQYLKYLANTARGSAKKRGQECSIDEDYLKRLWRYQGGLCYWTSTDMHLESNIGVKNPAQVSLDRLDNGIGYTPGNVVLTTMASNLGRNSVSYVLYYDFVVNQLGLKPLPLDLTYLKYL